MKWLAGSSPNQLAESSPNHLFTNLCVINQFICGHGVVIYYVYLFLVIDNKCL